MVNPFDGLIHNKDGTVDFPTNTDHPNVFDEVHPDGGHARKYDSYTYNHARDGFKLSQKHHHKHHKHAQ